MASRRARLAAVNGDEGEGDRFRHQGQGDGQARQQFDFNAADKLARRSVAFPIGKRITIREGGEDTKRQDNQFQIFE